MNLKNFIHETISEYLLLELTADEIKQKYYPNIEQDIFDSIFKSDKISSNYEKGKLGMYAKWLLKLYINNKLDTNKLDTIQNYISIFDRLSKSNRLEIKDINRYNSIEDMYQVVEPYLDTNKPISNREIREQDTRKVFEDSRFLVVQPLTEESSIRYGKGTKWCTASAEGGNEFNEYNKRGSIYIIMDKTKRNSTTGDYEKYQIHFESGQFMYSDDTPIDFDKNPEIKDIIKKIVNIEKIDDFDLVKINPKNIQFIDNPSEDIQLEAVKQRGGVIEYIDNPSEQVQLEAVGRSGNAIRYIIKMGITPSEQVQLKAVKHQGDAIQYIDNPSEQVQLEAVKYRGDYIKYIVNPTEQAQLESVKQWGYAIKFIDNPTEQAQLEAVKKWGDAFYYIIRKGIVPSEQVQLEAVRRSGNAIKLVFEMGITPTEQVQLEAVKKWGDAFYYIIRKGIVPSEQVQLEAVKRNGDAIKYIDNPSDTVIRASKGE